MKSGPKKRLSFVGIMNCSSFLWTEFKIFPEYHQYLVKYFLNIFLNHLKNWKSIKKLEERKSHWKACKVLKTNVVNKQLSESFKKYFQERGLAVGKLSATIAVPFFWYHT